MIARGDNGGLGTICQEFARAMQPDRVLVIDLGGRGRGPLHMSRFDGLDARVATHPPQPDALAWLIEGSDVIYTAETGYSDELWAMADAAGVATVLHAMPELWRPEHKPTQLWLPTTWEIDRFEYLSPEVVPVPIALDRFERRQRTEAVHFAHIAAPAFLDRNGTKIAKAAARYRRSKLSMRGERTGLRVHNYWDVLGPDVDILVMPRRYGGLSLPMQEALGQGIPVVTSDLEPQRGWPGCELVSCLPTPKRTNMLGGVFEVWDMAPPALSEVITGLVSNPEHVQELSRAALRYGEELSWYPWASLYRARFEALAA